MTPLRTQLATILTRAARGLMPGGRQIAIPPHLLVPPTGLLAPSGDPPTALQTQMQMTQAPQADAATAFPPGAPLRPAPGVIPARGPRQFDYPVGYNVAQLPRGTETSSFATLRQLAAAYEGIRLCERVWFDVVSRLVPTISFLPNIIPDGESEQDPKWRAIVQPAEALLVRPDRVLPLSQWLVASVKDVLELGASAIFLQRDRLGHVLALELIDAATIKPLVDDRGRQPVPPYPAFQQFIYGVPGGQYTRDEIEYITESSRTDSVYPTSRVEDILLRVNLALRKGALDLTRFTDGAIPEGFLRLSTDDADLTVEQQEEYEARLNGLLAGNDQLKVRLKVLPPGVAEFIATRQADPSLDLDTFLLNLTVAEFGLTMDEIAMTGSSNRSVGQTQQNVLYRRIVAPLAARYAALFTRIIQDEVDPRLIVTWGGFEETEDVLLKAQALDIGVKDGALSPSRMARLMGWPVDLEVPPMVLTKDGPVWLEDAMLLRQAQLDAKLASLQFPTGAPGAAQAPAPAAAPDEEEESPATSPPAPAKVPASPARAEYRRWREVALRAVKAGKAVPLFTSGVIPSADHARLTASLRDCVTPDQVRAAFTDQQERADQPDHPAAHARAALEARARRIFTDVGHARHQPGHASAP